ncbi:MupG family TIM beta-alpha barrel fold protein, partial [Streptococcus suis]
MSSFYYQSGIRTEAFVSAQTASEGPWPLSEALPTLEDHRLWLLPLQIAWIKATGFLDS